MRNKKRRWRRRRWRRRKRFIQSKEKQEDVGLVNTFTCTRDRLSSLRAEDFSNNLPAVRHVIAAHLLYPNLNPKP